MTITRRQLFTSLTVALATVASGCALRRSSQRPLASISGHVFGCGLRFGASTAANAAGRYKTTFVVPGRPVMLMRLSEENGRMVWMDKTYTNSQGYFEFNDVPGGEYYVGIAEHITRVHVEKPIPYSIGLFQSKPSRWQ